MGLFRKDPKEHIHEALVRIVNKTASFSANLTDSERREDSRSGRTLPVIILPLSNGSSANSLARGFTQDISREGLSIVTMEEIPDGEFAVAFECEETLTVVRCECVRHKPMGFGCFLNGLQVVELMQADDLEALTDGKWQKAIQTQMAPIVGIG